MGYRSRDPGTTLARDALTPTCPRNIELAKAVGEIRIPETKECMEEENAKPVKPANEIPPEIASIGRQRFGDTKSMAMFPLDCLSSRSIFLEGGITWLTQAKL